MEKQMKYVMLESLEYLDQVDLDNFITTLNQWKEEHFLCSNLSIEIYRVSWGDEGDYEIRLYGRRPETDEEFSKRVEYEEGASKRKEEADKRKFDEELREYIRLKRRFEGKKNIQEKLDGK